MKDSITLNGREQRRGQILGWLVEGRVQREEAARAETRSDDGWLV